jgi:hypothetical protein
MTTSDKTHAVRLGYTGDLFTKLSIYCQTENVFKNYIDFMEGIFDMAKKVNVELLSIDRRIISRKLLAGEIYEKDLHSLLKKLPDVSDNAEEVNPDDNKK